MRYRVESNSSKNEVSVLGSNGMSASKVNNYTAKVVPQSEGIYEISSTGSSYLQNPSYEGRFHIGAGEEFEIAFNPSAVSGQTGTTKTNIVCIQRVA